MLFTGGTSMNDAPYFLEKAEQLSRLIKKVRLGRIPKKDICLELDQLANEFMENAVALDTARDKAAKFA
jgi:hypothetical protein